MPKPQISKKITEIFQDSAVILEKRMDEIKNDIQEWKNGRFNYKQAMIYNLVITLIVGSLLLGSYLLNLKVYDYSILNDMISYLGDWQTNPDGWMLFCIDSILMGILYYPLNIYVYRVLVHYYSNYSTLLKIGKNGLIAVTYTMILIGFLPDVRGDVYLGPVKLEILHLTAAVIHFIFYVTGMLAYSAVIIHNELLRPEKMVIFGRNGQKLQNNDDSAEEEIKIRDTEEVEGKRPTLKYAAAPAIIFIIIVLGTIVTQIMRQLFPQLTIHMIFNISIWEWGLFLSYFVILNAIMMGIFEFFNEQKGNRQKTEGR